MTKHIFTKAEKYAVWETHGYACYWCGEPLDLQHATVDHVIPEHLEEYDRKLAWVKEHYSLPEDFVINNFENWVPSHANCNSRKSFTLYHPSPAFIAILHSIIKKASIARGKHDKLIAARNKDKVIGKILVELENGWISKSDLVALLQTTNDEQVPIVTESAEGKLYINLSEQWKVIKSMPNDLALVTDGLHVGITPTTPDPHMSWWCPNCGNYGPWNGVICMSCGLKSDPFD